MLPNKYSISSGTYGSVFKGHRQGGPIRLPHSVLDGVKFGAYGGATRLPTWPDWRRPGSTVSSPSANAIISGFSDAQMKRFMLWMDTFWSEASNPWSQRFLKDTTNDWIRNRREIVMSKLAIIERLALIRLNGPQNMEDWVLLFLWEDGELVIPSDVGSIYQAAETKPFDEATLVDDWVKDRREPEQRITFWTVPRKDSLLYMANQVIGGIDGNITDASRIADLLIPIPEVVDTVRRFTRVWDQETKDWYNQFVRGNHHIIYESEEAREMAHQIRDVIKDRVFAEVVEPQMDLARLLQQKAATGIVLPWLEYGSDNIRLFTKEVEAQISNNSKRQYDNLRNYSRNLDSILFKPIQEITMYSKDKMNRTQEFSNLMKNTPLAKIQDIRRAASLLYQRLSYEVQVPQSQIITQNMASFQNIINSPTTAEDYMSDAVGYVDSPSVNALAERLSTLGFTTPPVPKSKETSSLILSPSVSTPVGKGSEAVFIDPNPLLTIATQPALDVISKSQSPWLKGYFIPSTPFDFGTPGKRKPISDIEFTPGTEKIIGSPLATPTKFKPRPAKRFAPSTPMELTPVQPPPKPVLVPSAPPSPMNLSLTPLPVLQPVKTIAAASLQPVEEAIKTVPTLRPRGNTVLRIKPKLKPKQPSNNADSSQGTS